MANDPRAHDEIVGSALNRIDELMVTMHDLARERRWVRLATYCELVQANTRAIASMCDQLTDRDKKAPPSEPKGIKTR